jgi:hypothetical protein
MKAMGYAKHFKHSGRVQQPNEPDNGIEQGRI